MALATPATSTTRPTGPEWARLQAKVAATDACICNNQPVPCDDCARIFAEARAFELAHEAEQARAREIAQLNERNPAMAQTIRALDRGMRYGLRGATLHRSREEDH